MFTATSINSVFPCWIVKCIDLLLSFFKSYWSIWKVVYFELEKALAFPFVLQGTKQETTKLFKAFVIVTVEYNYAYCITSYSNLP